MITKPKPKKPKNLRELLQYYNSVVRSLQVVARECMRGAMAWQKAKDSAFESHLEKNAQMREVLDKKDSD